MDIKQSLLMMIFTVSIGFAQDTILKNYPETNQRWEVLKNKGKKVQETIYYDTGQSWMTAKYGSDKKEYWKWYYENGKPFFEATIIDDKIEGNYQIWYENGQLAEHLNFIGQIEEGPAQFYHRNGQLAMKGNYRNGKMVGNWEFFDENGCYADGEWKWFFAALPEQIRIKGMLENGKRVGKWTYHTTSSGIEKKQFVEFFH
ncbi:MAG: hypothetical protein AAF688_10180 [Bacteroidota bacterium]